MIKETRVYPVMQRLYCDKCDTEMMAEGQTIMTNPPQYPHRCPNCQNQFVSIGKMYPNVDFRENPDLKAVK